MTREQYKSTQNLAEYIKMFSLRQRVNQQTFEQHFDKFGYFLEQIKNLDTFASKVAETVEKSMNVCGRQIAFVSSKQAWVLACAAVENNINL